MTVNPTLNINRLSEKGEGIAEFSGREIYVRGAVPGDVVTLNVGEPFARGSKRCPGKIISFAEKSPLRGSFLCPHSQDCGSCTLGLLSAKAQIDIKRQDISEALASIGATRTRLRSFLLRNYRAALKAFATLQMWTARS